MMRHPNRAAQQRRHLEKRARIWLARTRRVQKRTRLAFNQQSTGAARYATDPEEKRT